MAGPVQFSTNIRSSTEPLSSKPLNQELDQTVKADSIVFQPRSSSKSIKLKLLNCLTFKLYEKLVENPKQWQAFRNALLTDFEAHSDLNLNKGKKEIIDNIFTTYHHHSTLSKTKASIILADYNAIIGHNKNSMLLKSQPLDSSQNIVARALRSTYELARPLTHQEKTVLARAKSDAVNQGTKSAVMNILRPGHGMCSPEILRGQEAIKHQAEADSVAFEYSNLGVHERCNIGERLQNVFNNSKKEIQRLQSCAKHGQRTFLSIPLGLLDTQGIKLTRENHVVEVAADFNNKTIMYLDSKALPLDKAAKKYDNASDLRAGLQQLGHQLFDTNNSKWDANIGIVEFSKAKQQGANDCGAFTHQSTKLLCDGYSVGDIERSFTAKDRSDLRIKMANDVLEDNHSVNTDLSFVPAYR